MRRPRSPAAALAVPLLLLASAASAQVPWESPRMTAGDAPGGATFLYGRFSSLPGAGPGALMLWHPPGLPDGVSLRAGAARGFQEGIAGFGGVDVSAPLVRRTETMPLDLQWSTGIGAGVREFVLVTLPVGVTAGRAWSSGQVWLHPWVGVHVLMDWRA